VAQAVSRIRLLRVQVIIQSSRALQRLAVVLAPGITARLGTLVVLSPPKGVHLLLAAAVLSAAQRAAQALSLAAVQAALTVAVYLVLVVARVLGRRALLVQIMLQVRVATVLPLVSRELRLPMVVAAVAVVTVTLLQEVLVAQEAVGKAPTQQTPWLVRPELPTPAVVEVVQVLVTTVVLAVLVS
jgi:hypothetical protein